MPRIPLRLILAITAAALSVTLLAWSLSPPGQLLVEQPLTSGLTQLPEARTLLLDFPPAVRAGEGGRLRLSIKGADSAQAAGIPNVYDTHNVLAEARLDMAGMNVRPPDTVTEPLLPGQGVAFFWSVRPNEVGRFTGTVWFYLRFVPKNGGPEHRQAVSAQGLEIESTTLFGLQGEPARWLGVAGVFVSSLLGIPFLVDMLKWLFKKE